MAAGRSPQLQELARERFLHREKRPLFKGDWLRAVFIHCEIDPEILQPHIPFPLDLREGKAYVSFVAFTMHRLRPRFGGKVSEWIFRPIATHEFFNVRTYVCHEDEPGIYFIAEWLSNWLSTQLGPISYGLPYRYGKIHYQHQPERRTLRGLVQSNESRFEYSGNLDEAACTSALSGSLSEFLLERYTAYTGQGNRLRCFRIWHEPWEQKEIDIEIRDDSLVTRAGSWSDHVRFVSANYSPGVFDVWMSAPHPVPRTY